MKHKRNDRQERRWIVRDDRRKMLALFMKTHGKDDESQRALEIFKAKAGGQM